jgi:hypothetical protein
MIGSPVTPTSERTSVVTRHDEGTPRRSRRWLPVTAAAVVAIAGIVIGITQPFAQDTKTTSGVVDNGYPTSTATVTRQDLTAQTQVNATLGYAGSYRAVNQAQGTITGLPAVGQVVVQGQVLYQVSGKPVVLLYGSTPAYRTLSQGMSGSDVTELNVDLVALGYATSSQLSPTSDYFSYETALALEKLQKAHGVDQSGTLSFGDAVFLPSAARVTTISATLGAPAQSGQSVLTATSTTRQIVIDLGASQQSEVKAGDKVTITLPNNQTTAGVVSSVGTVATNSSSSSGSSSGSPTVTVIVTPTDPAATGSLDQAPVQVSITTANVPNALVVPVSALLAQSRGGYAVEVVDPDGVRRLVSVTLGLFDDSNGLIELNGSGLSAGQRVVVPAL